MCLVLHDCVGGQVEDSAQGVSNAGGGSLVTGGFIPNGNDVLLKERNKNGTSEAWIVNPLALELLLT